MTMTHLLMFTFNLLGFVLILPTMQRHQRHFAKRFSLLNNANNLQKIRWGGFSLLFLSLILCVTEAHVWLYLVAWFGWLSLAAGTVFVALQVQERLEKA